MPANPGSELLCRSAGGLVRRRWGGTDDDAELEDGWQPDLSGYIAPEVSMPHTVCTRLYTFCRRGPQSGPSCPRLSALSV